MRAVPVFLISHNRLTCLKRLVDWLERAGFENIHIVDNASEYPPLLEYLARSPHRVTRLSANLGHLAVWKCGRFDRLLHTEEYIVSDPDVLPCPDCPLDAAWVFHTLLQRHPEATKVGFSLRLDDIPDSFPQKRDVLAWEKKFWENRAPGEAAFRAAIDTTFALYRPGVFPEHPAWFEALRTDTPYTARHLGWYPDFDSEEERQYRARLDARFSNWGANDPESLKKENLRLRGQVAELQARLDLLSRPWGNRVALLARKSLLRARDILGRRR